MELLLYEYRMSIWDSEKVQKMDSGDGFTTSWIYLLSLIVHLKMVKMVNFMLCIVYHNDREKERKYSGYRSQKNFTVNPPWRRRHS